MGWILNIAVLYLAYLIGVAGQTTIDACQKANVRSTSFKIHASYYWDRPGVCTCSISIVNRKFKTKFRTRKTPLVIKANVMVLDEDACGYLIGPSGSDAENCSMCISSPSLEFRKETNYTLELGRPYNHTTRTWFIIDARDTSSQLAVRCWLDERMTVMLPCVGVSEYGPNATTTVTMISVNTVRSSVHSPTPDVLGIMGWSVSGVLAIVIVGFVIYTRLKTRKSSGPNRLQGGDSVSTDTTARGLTHQLADHSESNGEYQTGAISAYQDLQYRPSDEQVYEAIVDSTNDDMGYEQPITARK